MGGYTTEPTALTEIGTEVLPYVHRWSGPQTPRVVVPTPICRMENFLGATHADALLSHAISRQADFTDGTVMDPLTGQLSHKDRNSLVLPAHSTAFHQYLSDCLPQVIEMLGMDTTPSQAITALTAHGTDSYFGIHTDATKVPHPATAVSAIYYLHRRPRGFDGGQLRIYDTAVHDGRAGRADTCTVIEPDHDTIVFFPASAFHEVMVSRCPSGQFADHRFTLTSWISAPTTAPEPQTASQALRWMARAAEHTRPLPGVGRNHHGAIAAPLPPQTAARPTV
ncbi:2OG-Fe(II) oxygenase [Streptomyces natalensis]|uniref:2OG-Fe(II) oxygenase n=1 Tax=Streptomyces natalensis TaxID=68242 RepID=UPI0004AADBDF|nr:2OG-Fe(II) oxygenase [Streptomyces natalensis]